MILTPVEVGSQCTRRETLRCEDNSNEQVTKRHDETLTAGNSLRTPRPATKKKLSSGPTDSSSGPGTKQSTIGKLWFLSAKFVSFQSSILHPVVADDVCLITSRRARALVRRRHRTLGMRFVAVHMNQKRAFMRSQHCYCLKQVDALLREWAPLRLTASSGMRQRPLGR